MLEAGIKGKKEITVTQDKTAKAMCSGALDVFATPAMIALMENTAFLSVAGELEPGSGTVGTALNVKHVSATPVGMKVTCETELVKVDGRALTFSVKAYDEAGLIGEGEHERFIIFEEKFQAKADAKIQA
jgi:predicted thioesterase